VAKRKIGGSNHEKPEEVDIRGEKDQGERGLTEKKKLKKSNCGKKRGENCLPEKKRDHKKGWGSDYRKKRGATRRGKGKGKKLVGFGENKPSGNPKGRGREYNQKGESNQATEREEGKKFAGKNLP